MRRRLRRATRRSSSFSAPQKPSSPCRRAWSRQGSSTGQVMHTARASASRRMRGSSRSPAGAKNSSVRPLQAACLSRFRTSFTRLQPCRPSIKQFDEIAHISTCDSWSRRWPAKRRKLPIQMRLSTGLAAKAVTTPPRYQGNRRSSVQDMSASVWAQSPPVRTRPCPRRCPVWDTPMQLPVDPLGHRHLVDGGERADLGDAFEGRARRRVVRST